MLQSRWSLLVLWFLSSIPLTNRLGFVPTTICITTIFMVHSYFRSLAKSRYLSLLSSSFNFTQWSACTPKTTICQVFVFFLHSLGQAVWMKIRDPFISQNPRKSIVSHFPGRGCLWIFHLLVCSGLNFLHSSLWITLPTHSCLVLYTFRANLLYSVILGLTVSSLSPHKAHLLILGGLSIFAFYTICLWRCFLLL